MSFSVEVSRIKLVRYKIGNLAKFRQLPDNINEGIKAIEDKLVHSITQVFTGRHNPRSKMVRTSATHRNLIGTLSVNYAPNYLENFHYRLQPTSHPGIIRFYSRVIRGRKMKLVRGGTTTKGFIRNGKAYRREGRSRYHLRRLYGPSVAQMAGHPLVQKRLNATAIAKQINNDTMEQMLNEFSNRKR